MNYVSSCCDLIHWEITRTRCWQYYKYFYFSLLKDSFRQRGAKNDMPGLCFSLFKPSSVRYKVLNYTAVSEILEILLQRNIRNFDRAFMTGLFPK